MSSTGASCSFESLSFLFIHLVSLLAISSGVSGFIPANSAGGRLPPGPFSVTIISDLYNFNTNVYSFGPDPELYDLIQNFEYLGGSCKQKNSHNQLICRSLMNFASLFCDPNWIRTNGPHLRRMTLYPAELWDRNLNCL